MKQQHRILVFGESLFVQAITTGLQKDPTIDVFTLDPRSPLLRLQLSRVHPALLIIEVGGEIDLPTSDLFAADIPMLIVNIQTGRSKLLIGESLPIVETAHPPISNLASLINQIEMGSLSPLACVNPADKQ